MDNEEKLATLKELLDIDNVFKDGLLSVYLLLAGEKILQRAYPFDSSKTEVPDRYALLQCQIAEFMYNKRGAEGQTYHSESGINRTYESADIPKSLLRGIVPFVEVL